MKNHKRIVATALLTATAMMQLTTTALAAKTDNAATDTRSDSYNNTAHTTFGVIETDKDVSGQVSYEVPLYVTMAATPGRNNMLLPEAKEYYIENTSPDIVDGKNPIETNPIGVTSLKVVGLDTNTWKIRKKQFVAKTEQNKDEYERENVEGNAHLMSFSLGKIQLGDDDKPWEGKFEHTLFDESMAADGKNQSSTHWNKLKASNQFVEFEGYIHKGGLDGQQEVKDNALVKIGKGAMRMNVELESTIANLTPENRKNGGDTSTTGLFKVQYTLAALDENGQPKTAAVYAGDDWTLAGYKQDPSNKKN